MTAAPRDRVATAAALLGAVALLCSPFLHWVEGAVTETDYVLRGYGAVVSSGVFDGGLATGFDKAGVLIVALIVLTGLVALALAAWPRAAVGRTALALGGVTTLVIALRVGLFQPDDGLGDAAVHMQPGGFVAILGAVLCALGGLFALAGPRPDATRGWASIALAGAAVTSMAVVLRWATYAGTLEGTTYAYNVPGHDTPGLVLVVLILLVAASAAVLGVGAALQPAREVERLASGVLALGGTVAVALAVRLFAFPPALGSGDADAVDLGYGVAVAFAGLALCAVAGLGCRSAAARDPRVPSDTA